MPNGKDGRLGAVTHTKLSDHGADMTFDRLRRDKQFV